MAVKEVLVLGGPNGAGKTTAAAIVLPQMLNIREFVNADEIARGLSPFNPEGSALAAGKIMIERMRELIGNGESFAFETTCASHRHIRMLRGCRDKGYRITLVFLWLPSAEIALARVARRVAQGGHRIPDDVVVRRYAAGMKNMRHSYLPIADIAYIYDNTDNGGVLIAERQPGVSLLVRDGRRWDRIVEATGG